MYSSGTLGINVEVTKPIRSEEHTSELQSRLHLVCRLLLEKKNKHTNGTPRLQFSQTCVPKNIRTNPTSHRSNSLQTVIVHSITRPVTSIVCTIRSNYALRV